MIYNLTNPNQDKNDENNDHFFDIEAQTVVKTKNDLSSNNTFNFNYYYVSFGFVLLIAGFIMISGFHSINGISTNSISSKHLLTESVVSTPNDPLPDSSQQSKWFDSEQHGYKDLFDRIYADGFKTEYEIWAERCEQCKEGLPTTPNLCDLCAKHKTSEAIEQFNKGETKQYGHALPKVAIVDRYKLELKEKLQQQPTTSSSSLSFAKVPNDWNNQDMSDKLSLVLKNEVVNPYLKYLGERRDDALLINVTGKGWGGKNGYGYIENAGWTTDPSNSGKTIERWYPNFADPSLFFAGKFWLLGQDEQMSLEMPLLWGLRQKFVEEMELHSAIGCNYTVQKARIEDFEDKLKNCKHQLFNGAVMRNVPQFFNIEVRDLGVFGDEYELYEKAGGTRSDDGKWTMTTYPGTDKDKTDAKWTMHYNGFQFKKDLSDTTNFKVRENPWTETNNLYIFAAIGRGTWKPMRKWEWGNEEMGTEPYTLKPRQIRICKGELKPKQEINMVAPYPMDIYAQSHRIKAILCRSSCVKYGELKQADKDTLLQLWKDNNKAATLNGWTSSNFETPQIIGFLTGYQGDLHLCYEDWDVSGQLIWFGNNNHHWQPIQSWKWGQLPQGTPTKKNLNPKAKVRLCPDLKAESKNHPLLGRLCKTEGCISYGDLDVPQQEQLRDQWLTQHKSPEIKLTTNIDGLGNIDSTFYFCYDDDADLQGLRSGGSGEYIYYGSYNGESDNLPYTMDQFNMLFRKAFTTFALIRDTARSETDSFHEIHLGNWGGGIFQNDVIGNLLVQFVAAASADIDGIIYHDPPKMGIVTLNVVREWLEDMSNKVFQGKASMSLQDFLNSFEEHYVKTKTFKFGQVTSWISSNDVSAQNKE